MLHGCLQQKGVVILEKQFKGIDMFRILLFTCLYIGQSSLVLAQATTGTVGQSPARATFWEAVWQGLNLTSFGLFDVAMLVVGMTLGIFGDRIVLSFRRRFLRKNPRLASKSLGQLQMNSLPGQKLLVLGGGGTGKSSLIGKLSGSPGREKQKTGKSDFLSFAITLEVSNRHPNGSGLLISAADYNGQQPGEIPGVIRKLTLNGKSPLTAIMLVLDLSEAPSDATANARRTVIEPDEERINMHLREWGGNGFEVLKGVEGANAPRVFIFVINAIDCVQRYADVLKGPLTSDKNQEISEKFKSLTTQISGIWEDCRYETVIGSANSPNTIEQLRKILISHSVPGGAG